VKLEAMCRGPEEALLTCKHMLQIWKSFYNLTNPRYTHKCMHTLPKSKCSDPCSQNTETLQHLSTENELSNILRHYKWMKTMFDPSMCAVIQGVAAACWTEPSQTDDSSTP